jgi:hypothetical protein
MRCAPEELVELTAQRLHASLGSRGDRLEVGLDLAAVGRGAGPLGDETDLQETAHSGVVEVVGQPLLLLPA